MEHLPGAISLVCMFKLAAVLPLFSSALWRKHELESLYGYEGYGGYTLLHVAIAWLFWQDKVHFG